MVVQDLYTTNNNSMYREVTGWPKIRNGKNFGAMDAMEKKVRNGNIFICLSMNKRTMNDLKRVFLILDDLEKVRSTGRKPK